MAPLKQSEGLLGGCQAFPGLTEGPGHQSRMRMAAGSQGTTGKELGEESVRRSGRGATLRDEGETARPSVLLSLGQESKSQDRGCGSRSSRTCTPPGGTGRGEGGRCAKAGTVARRSSPRRRGRSGKRTGIVDGPSAGPLPRSAAVCQVPAVNEHSPLSRLRSGEGRSITQELGDTQVVLYRKKKEAGSRVLIFKRTSS